MTDQENTEFEWTRDYIFPTFFYTRKSTFDVAKIKKEIFDNSEGIDSVKISNRGGWQSDSTRRQHVQKDFEFYKLFDYVEESAKNVFKEEGFDYEIQDIVCWANISNNNDYNVVHTHGASALCAIFYVSLPDAEETGIEFLRNDGAAYIRPYSSQTIFKPTVAEGTLAIFSPHLMHYVVPNKSAEPRVSIAFNVY